MGKKKSKKLRMNYGKGKARRPGRVIPQVQITTKYLTKKGKLKGKNKKETALLKAACPHHIYDDDSPIADPIIYNASDGTKVCTACGSHFSGHFYSKSEIKDILDPVIELSNQMKYMSVAVGADNKTIETVVRGHIYLKEIKKIYKNMRKVAASKSKVKKNKKKKKNVGGSQYGSWR